jgi:sodium-dependent dicarboxylate transporter 2/3/5
MLDPLVQQVGSMAPTHDYRILLWVLVMATIFCTELLSNSVTAMAFWVLAIGVASHQGFEPTGLMLGIGLASTCAFMSPISTPATALAYGGFKAISLPTMLRLGFIVNIIAATIITLCSIYWIPWVLSSS